MVGLNLTLSWFLLLLLALSSLVHQPLPATPSPTRTRTRIIYISPTTNPRDISARYISIMERHGRLMF